MKKLPAIFALIALVPWAVAVESVPAPSSPVVPVSLAPALLSQATAPAAPGFALACIGTCTVSCDSGAIHQFQGTASQCCPSWRLTCPDGSSASAATWWPLTCGVAQDC